MEMLTKVIQSELPCMLFVDDRITNGEKFVKLNEIRIMKKVFKR